MRLLRHKQDPTVCPIHNLPTYLADWDGLFIYRVCPDERHAYGTRRIYTYTVIDGATKPLCPEHEYWRTLLYHYEKYPCNSPYCKDPNHERY